MMHAPLPPPMNTPPVTSPVNTAANNTCPLCGGPNLCALAGSGNVNVPCWCRDVVIDAATIARVPHAQRNTACLCARCAALPSRENA